jgi:HEPN domain-containing protein
MAQKCLDGKEYVYCLFFIHLSLEKTCKAIWVKANTNNHPPKIHDLIRLLKETKTELKDEDWTFLFSMNKFQLEGRYPDYVGKIYKECTLEFTTNILLRAGEIRKLLLQNL